MRKTFSELTCYYDQIDIALSQISAHSIQRGPLEVSNFLEEYIYN